VRVFILAARTGGVDPAEVLALREGVCGHPSPRQQSREGVAASAGGGVEVGAIAFHPTQTPISGEVSPAVGRTTSGMGVLAVTVIGNSGMESWKTVDVAIGLAARDAKGTNNVVIGSLDFGEHGGSYNGQDAYQGRIRADAGRPRRLTPLECERLMSWPDQWTATGRKENGTEYALSDTARYRLCGNGVGSVCAEWIGRRLKEAIA
jgi:site-specific DNA-cytosine methylase